MNHYLRSILLLIVVVFSYGVKGQLNYKPGYLVSLNNDTLFGKIKVGGGEIRNSKVCLFKATKDSKVKEYYPEDIKSYRIIGDKFYKSRDIFYKGEEKAVFMNVLLEGKLNLYYDWRNPSMKYFIEGKDGAMIGLSNEDMQVRLNPTDGHSEVYDAYRYTFLHLQLYKDTLESVFSDSRKILYQLKNVEYNAKSLTNITKAYIKETCTGNDCITYEKELSGSRPTFGVFSGVQMSQITFSKYVIDASSTVLRTVVSTNINSDVFATIPVGILYNIPLSRLNDNLSFQLELITSSMNYKQAFAPSPHYDTIVHINSRTIGFPLMLKYKFPMNKLTPTVAIGKELSYVLNSKVTIDSRELELHSFQKGGWFFELGLKYKLSPYFSAFSNLRFQSNNNLIISEQYGSTAYRTAVDKKYFEREYSRKFASLYIGLEF